jgi:hypothetical protein
VLLKTAGRLLLSISVSSKKKITCERWTFSQRRDGIRSRVNSQKNSDPEIIAPIELESLALPE